MRELRVQGVLVGPRASFEAFTRFLAQRRVRPAIDRVFALAEFRSAFETLARGDAFGKTCLRIAAP
jgi:D-arabinose 1-dehydrogenase-like Zn-dependent alcohol dehydrogenase